MRERRAARVGTVSGLALLTGGTAVAAVAHGTPSIFATVMLGLLAAGLSHALLTEIQRQARRGTAGWAVQDTINTVLLTAWTAGALVTALIPATPRPIRFVGLLLTFAYALSCAFFVMERRRTIAAIPASEDAAAGDSTTDTNDAKDHRPAEDSPAITATPAKRVN